MKILASIVGAIAVALFALTLTIDGIVKNNIEESASALLKTEVKVSDVDLSIFSGKGEIEGFAVINPKGFSEQVAIGFEQMNLEVKLSSLLSDTVIVEELIVQNPSVRLEQKENKINLKELNNNISSASSKDESSKKLVINYFLMEEGRATISSEADEIDGTEATISRLELIDIGKNSSNTLQQTMQQILEPVIQELVSKTVKNQILNQIENAVNDFIDG